LVRIGIALFGGEVDAPGRDPIPLYDTLNSVLVRLLPRAKLAITVSGFAIARSFTSSRREY
jgi:hypothetical protein